MKLAGLIYTFPLLLSVNCQRSSSNAGRCSYTTKRYDFELANDDVREAYFDTFRKWALMTGPGSLHEFVEIHDLNEETSHGVSCFLVWHRKFLKDAEDALRAINPNFVFLYWDWSRDHQKPHLAKVWDARYLGTNGKGADKIVRDGVMGNITCLWPRTRPHLLKRDFQNGDALPPFTAPGIIQEGLGECKNFHDAWKKIEMEFHATPHEAIGGVRDGDIGFEVYGDAATMHSPNDPFFWMHHMFLDMLWYSWQKKNGKENDYSGSTSELMQPWNARVGDYLDSVSYPVCAIYDRNFLNQDHLPNANPEATFNLFAKSSNVIFSSIKMIGTLTNMGFGIMKPIYTYTTNKITNYIRIGQLIKDGVLQNFIVKNDAKNIPHPDIILESSPISDHFIKMNHLDRVEVKKREAEKKIMGQAINSQLAMNNPLVLKWFQKMWKEEN